MVTIRAHHDRGDHKGAAAYFLSGFGLSAEETEETLRSPAGAAMVDCARALPYDYALLGDGLTPAELASQVATPTLVLAAEAMPEAAQELAAAIPNARFTAMPAPAYDLAPADLAEAVVPFLTR